jgi:hypothetical protein
VTVAADVLEWATLVKTLQDLVAELALADNGSRYQE